MALPLDLSGVSGLNSPSADHRLTVHYRCLIPFPSTAINAIPVGMQVALNTLYLGLAVYLWEGHPTTIVMVKARSFTKDTSGAISLTIPRQGCLRPSYIL